MQRLATDGGGQGGVPPIVGEVLSLPGEPLDAATRSFMEPRFGHDFGRVRVHADTRAADSAQAVSAHAYAVGSNIVFGAGRYAPHTREGQKLLAHELAHVVQQSHVPAGAAAMDLGRSGDRLERAADRAAEVVSAGSGRLDVPAMPQASRATLSRWKIAANVATVDSEQDRLGDLAARLKAGADNWQCIRPIRMRTAEVSPVPADFDMRYEGYLQIGDEFDLSNLQSGTGPTLRLSLFGLAENNHTVVSILYPGTQISKDPDQDIATASNEGKTPLADLMVAGHQAGGVMYGASGRFDISTASPDAPTPTFTRAKDAKFPRRCWFTPSGNARSVGCSSNSFGQSFAGVYLRSGGGIDTTLRLIHPSCTQAHRNTTGGCSSIDAIGFAPPGGREDADHGPFKLTAPQDFHASRFWDRIKGKL